MPPLLVTGRGAGAQILPETLWSVMAFPRDEADRQNFLARFWELEVAELEAPLLTDLGMPPREVSRALGESLGSLLEDVGGFSRLSAAPLFPELKQRLLNRVWPGQVAGEILRNLLQLHAANVGPSVNKAIALTQEFLRTSKVTTREGKVEGGTSERYIRKAWGDFKPACHLWAALLWWGDQGIEPGPLEEPAIDWFLAVAETFLRTASDLQSRARRERLFDMNEMWRVPRRYTRVRLTHLEVPPLEDWQLEVLKRWKTNRPSEE